MFSLPIISFANEDTCKNSVQRMVFSKYCKMNELDWEYNPTLMAGYEVIATSPNNKTKVVEVAVCNSEITEFIAIYNVKDCKIKLLYAFGWELE